VVIEYPLACVAWERRTSSFADRDLFPTVVEAVPVEPAPEDAGLPGRSLFRLAQEPPRSRIASSEYHAVFSPSGIFMVRDARYKYVHYVGYPPQLFDVVADPDECSDVASDPRCADVRSLLQRELRAIVDPEEADGRAKANQRWRIEAAGGADVILSGGPRISFTPAPNEFAPRKEARPPSDRPLGSLEVTACHHASQRSSGPPFSRVRDTGCGVK